MVAVENLAEYLLEQLKTKEVVRVPASESEFLEVAPEFDKPDVWLNTDYKTIDSVAQLGDLSLPLREIYHKIQFTQA